MNAYEYAQTNMQRSSLTASLAFPKAIDHVSAVQHLFEQVEWAVIVAVSYTHLDVYKRQAKNQIFSRLTGALALPLRAGKISAPQRTNSVLRFS